MTLTEFEEHAHAEFAKHLPVVADSTCESESEAQVKTLLARLEQKAMEERVEICKHMAWLLVFALYDMHLRLNADVLLVPPDYFECDRTKEDEADAYLHERRLGALPRHNDLTVN
jgi:hypothetical protein